VDAYQPLLGSSPPSPPSTGRPQVFVVAPDTIGTPQMRGIWLDPTQSYADVRSSLASAALLDEFVVIDQVDFGPIMLDELTDLFELRLMALTTWVFGRTR
jgi:hypothetical protein